MRQHAWLIVSLNEKDESGQPLYWSNDQGWVDRDSSDPFTNQDKETLQLPIGGRWERSDWRSSMPSAPRLAELVEALDQWLSRGGFLPEPWKLK